MTEQNIAAPLIDYWSYSSMSLFLRNRLAFKKKYILKIYDDIRSPSAVVGQACHKAVEMYLKGESVNAAIKAGLDQLNHTSDTGINYGKTGSREQMLKDYTTGVQFYFDELPNWKAREVLAIEEGYTEVIHDTDGNELPLPAKCFSDVVWRSTKEETFAGRTFPAGALFVEDNKFVRSYTDGETDDPARFIQCMFNYHVLKSKFGEAPVAMLYRECKLSKNKNGDPQCQYYVIEFAEHPDFFTLFYQLYGDCTREICRPDINFLPNPYDMFDGENSMLAYKQNLIGVEAPVQVGHKTKEVKFVEKTYHASASDKVENRHLEPEEKIRLKLQEFGIPVEMQETYRNGSVIMYTLKPSRGVKMKTIESHAKDLALVLEARSIRVQAPIMGTDMVGVEVPNENRSTVPFYLPDGTPDPQLLTPQTLSIPIGLNVYKQAVIKDLRDMPHLLVAGATGAGKSVMLNVILHSLTQQNSAEELKLVLIDPKRVELASFADLPHVMSRVIHEHREAIKALRWLCEEMEDRYKTLHGGKYRHIQAYNADHAEKMPYIVVVIDEFADLMLTKERGEPSEAELMIVRLAQKARAVGIHLVVATQRPSVDVVTGLIKANFPTRIAFMASSRTDSQIILDEAGAEELVGKGDMLFKDPSTRGLQRLQGFYA